MNLKRYANFCERFTLLFTKNYLNKTDTEKALLLEKANLPFEYTQYKAIIFASSIISSILSAVVLSSISIVLQANSILMIFTVPFVMGIAIWELLSFLPTIFAGSRQREIDRYLPFAVNYLNTMAKINIAPVEIFHSLSTLSTYGCIKEESLKIVKEVKIMGVDNITALKHAIDRSPSTKFKGFLQGLIGTIQSGSSLTTYLSNMADFYLREDLRKREKNLESLSLIAELFVVAVIAFPIFLIIIITVFGFIGSSSLATFEILYLLSFIVLPISYIGFYYLIKTTLNDDFKIDTVRETQFQLSDVYKKNKKSIQIILASIIANISFYIIFYALVAYGYLTFNSYYLYDIVFISILVMIGPIGLYSHLQSIKGKEIQERFPDFLVDMSNSLSSGMSVFDSINVSSKANYGKLTPQIKKMKIDISWHISLKNIFSNLSTRLKNKVIDRSIITINKGLFMGGSDAKIFQTLSKEIKQINEINSQRNVHMTVYFMVIVLSFFVFLFIMFVLNKTLFSYFFGFQETQSLDGLLASVDKIQLHYSLFCFTFVQGMGAGLLGGYMKDGTTVSALRYSLLLGIISIILFKVVI